MPSHGEEVGGGGGRGGAEGSSDYDLSRPLDTGRGGMRQGLTSYGDAHFSLFLRKAFIKALGYSEDALSRPVIGLTNTGSGFNPCHANMPQLLEAARRGVLLAGGIPVDFPTISLHESFAAPSSMFLRNLMSLDTEEMVRAQPVDAVVLVGGELLLFSFSFFFSREGGKYGIGERASERVIYVPTSVVAGFCKMNYS